MRLTRLSASITALLVLETGAPIHAATAAEESGSVSDVATAFANFPQFASVSDSAATNAPTILHGTLSQLTGSVMPAAHVLLSAWPRNEKLRDFAVGATFDPIPIARTIADEGGRYELRSEVTDLLRSLSDRDGLDIELDIFHADHHYVHLSQVTPTAEGTWIREITGLPEKISEVAEDVGTLLDLTLDRAKAALDEGFGLTGAVPTAYTYRKPTAPGCTPFEKVRDVIIPQTVATAVASNGAGVDVMYTEEARTESSTGGAFLGGAFTINGSRSRTFGLEVDFDDLTSAPGKSVNQEYQVRMSHTVWRRSCARDFQGNEDVLFVTSPTGAPEGDGQGTGFPKRSHYLPWTCTPTDPRTEPVEGSSRIATVNERAAAYQGAFTFEPIPGSGFTGNALSGYSRAVKVIFTFDRKTDVRSRFWCGRSGKPRSPGQRVQGFVG